MVMFCIIFVQIPNTISLPSIGDLSKAPGSKYRLMYASLCTSKAIR